MSPRGRPAADGTERLAYTAPRMSLLLLLSLAVAAPDAPTQPTISSDRPGFSYSAGVVPPGHWQTEFGIRGIVADQNALQLPILSARLGLTKRVELQLGFPSFTLADNRPNGLSDLAVGLKLGEAPKDWLAYSLVLLAVAPTGNQELSARRWQGAAALNVELYFAGSGWLSLNTHLGTFTNKRGNQTLAGTPSAALGWTILERFNPFAQAYLHFADNQTSPFVGAGLAFLLTRAIQLDLAADYDVDGQAVVIDGGISVLW